MESSELHTGRCAVKRNIVEHSQDTVILQMFYKCGTLRKVCRFDVIHVRVVTAFLRYIRLLYKTFVRKRAESLIIEIPCLHAIVVDRVIFLELCPEVGGVQIARQIR